MRIAAPETTSTRGSPLTGASPAPEARQPGFDDLEIGDLVRRTGVKWARAVRAGALPAWVADMDFPIAPAIRDALCDAARSGELGYPDWAGGTPLRAEFARRMQSRYGWTIDPADVREQTDLIQALQLILHVHTERGDGVVIQTPNYPPFLATIATMGRRTVEFPFVDTPEGWRLDFDALRVSLVAERPKVLVLVDPHNPTGRVHTRPELTRIAELAAEFDLLVVSDEIHAELIYAPHRHIPFASIGADAAARTITLTSAGKAFNIAGLRCAVAHYGSKQLLAVRDREPPDLYGTVSTPAVLGTLAAWRHGQDWQEALLRVLDRNRRRVDTVLREHLPEARHHRPEGTYLSWVDVSALAVDDPVRRIRDLGRVLVDGGRPFGRSAEAFVRINFATSGAVLEHILDGVSAALRGRRADSPLTDLLGT
ncbi:MULTISPECIES: MalY/PatB family protein [Rhodococcus]|uniref:MalY/PatB family protein n=1 Tax=Rhodococcus TaxID=1827 RepID=UPI000C15CD37|nr:MULTISPECIES: aminotransferase class I/II-fold pyridoxal phosphate-dependent enzyme [Rhodococcus]ATQ30867.1 aminotransferase [Rhodococcus ruber]AUM16575.1 aminotransferase [Rhodococcus ruber]MBD8052190.1 aminotransferase class I/II-fold pyridoxal phosphate-dependent enzyme [Rhodococcus ruber]MCF8784258.1 aminotransferase class I/II-fold pyridoxal phosphate-dependent enzyme [Rhodococcus ruber]